MELHKDIKTMEDKISDLREENANNVKREGGDAAANVPAGGANTWMIDG